MALFTIGAVLCRAGRHAHSRTPVGLYLPVALIKLFLHPLLVFVLIISALAQSKEKMGKQFGTVIVLYLVSTFLAAAIAVVAMTAPYTAMDVMM